MNGSTAWYLMYLSKGFHAILIKISPLKSRAQGSSVFSVVSKEDNIGNDE